MAKSILTQIGEAVKTKTDKVVKDAAAVSKELTKTVNGFDERISTTETKLEKSASFLNGGSKKTNGACSGKCGASYSSLDIKLPELMSNITGTITVNDGTTNWCGGSGGKSCTWTVPSGVSIAEFQIWGAGGNGTGYATCCGFGRNGADGAYLYTKVKVKPGDQYILCAGGACQSGACPGAYACHGCTSFVCRCEGGKCFRAVACGGSACSCAGFRHIYTGDQCDCDYGYSYTVAHRDGFADDNFGNFCVCLSENENLIDVAGVKARRGISTSSCHQNRFAISAVHVHNDHTLSACCCHAVVSGGGCCFYNIDRGPGRGGWGGGNGSCCNGNGYGAYGNTGQVLVRYK